MGAKHTPGPWRSIIDDTGGQWSGWPLCITAENEDDKTVVRTGGQWPYEWDAATSQREAVANARLIASAPDLLEALIASLSLDPLRMELEDCLDDEREALVAELQQIEAQISAAIARATGEAA
jgi:hypothetical protein